MDLERGSSMSSWGLVRQAAGRRRRPPRAAVVLKGEHGEVLGDFVEEAPA